MIEPERLVRTTVEKLRELGVEDPDVLAEIEQSLSDLVQETETRDSLSRVWPSPQTWLAALVGAALGGSLSPEDLAAGTATSVAASSLVEVSWKKIRQMFPREKLPSDPAWTMAPTVEDRRRLDPIISEVVRESSQWQPRLDESQRRMESAYLRMASQNLHRPGPLGDLARMVV